MKKAIFTTLLALTMTAALQSFSAQQSAMPKPGDKAPAVEGKDQDGNNWRLQDEHGKHAVLLYFYPKDDTPGCTKEACGLRDRMADLKKQDVQVIGVSFDTGESHKKFIGKYNLNFPLIADTDGTIANRYGVKNPERNIARRVSFLIDKNGVIRHVTDNPKADVHLDEMQQAVASLKTGAK